MILLNCTSDLDMFLQVKTGVPCFSFLVGVVQDWKSDEWFVKERFITNPASLTQIHRLPFLIDNLQDLMQDNRNISEALSTGHFYMVDYAWMLQLKEYVQNGRYASSPIALFYHHSNGQLVPIAIKPLADSPSYYTPASAPHVWLLSKILFNSADAFYQSVQHFIDSHIMIEAVHTSLLRNIGESHPVFVLLNSAFKIIHGNFILAMKILLNEGGSFDQNFSINRNGVYAMMRWGAKKWSFLVLSF